VRLFGTNGVRGVFGRDVTAEFALRFGRAVGGFLGGRLAVGTDTRTSADVLREAVSAGLAAAGCDVLHLGVLPTPALQLYVPMRHLSGGVAVTASHNPAEYNGFKVVDADGMDLSRSEEEQVEAAYAAGKFAEVPWSRTGQVHHAADAVTLYLDEILNRVDVEAVRKASLKVVVDCANGAAVHTTPYLLRRLGCSVLTLNGHPDGTFPGRHPEPREEHLTELKRLVADTGADLGIAHDGDADRAVFLDDRGRYVHGDRALAVVAREVMRSRPGVLVTPVTSSSCVEEVVRAAGGSVDYTAVGAPVVSRRMREVGAVLGGEESGGMMFPELHCAKDGGMSAAKVLELIATTGKRLAEHLDALPAYHLARRSVPVPAEARDRVLAAIKEATRGERVLTVDGFRVDRDVGWVLVRPSGTEPLFRIYAEARTAGDAERLAAYGEGLITTGLR